MLVLIGIVIVMAGFALRLNPLPFILLGAIATGVASSISPQTDLVALASAAVDTLARFGTAFNDNRYFHVPWLILPLIGVLERVGLQQRAREFISKTGGATPGRLLLLYLGVRQATAALGLISLGGHAQMVRPLIAPMAEGAAESRFGAISDRIRYRIRAMAAATDNVGVFFGEDIFIAIGSIVLIVGVLQQAGIHVDALHVSLWAIPTAICAFLIHGARVLLLDREVARASQPSETQVSHD